MTQASPPPEIRVLCRKLTAIPPSQLCRQLPLLTGQIIRCKAVLAAPQELKLKDDSSQNSLLVHKLQTALTTLLNGRNREGRLVATCLIKAVVDVAGWEVLRSAEPWVRGLLSIIQKGDPVSMKELAIVAVTRIYVLVQPYQTLAREMATSTMAAFITASLQLIKQNSSTQAFNASFTETVCDAFSTLIPLYPTLFRPSSSQIRSITRPFLTPTCTDELMLPGSLSQAARRLVISLHHVAAKSGGSEEWNKHVDGLLRELHQTADRLFRAVDESWQPTDRYDRSKVDLDGEPRSDGTGAEHLTPWTGIVAGADRLAALFDYLCDSVRYPTKAAVTIPLGAFMDAITRVCVIARLGGKSQTWDQAVDTNPGIGRDEKDELWSVMPDLHVAALKLITCLLETLQKDMLPMIPEALDHLVRTFKSGIHIPSVRQVGFQALISIASIAGTTMSKSTIDMLDPLIGGCCRDLQEDAGFLKPAERPPPTGKEVRKNGSIVANADLFLQPQNQATTTVSGSTLESDHQRAAATLLSTLLSLLPQRHLKPTMRGLLDKTAILTRNRDAMLSSVLNPYKDQRGRMYPSILPFLSQQYPQDPSLEVLHSILRTSSVAATDDISATLNMVAEAEESDPEDQEMKDHSHEVGERDDPQTAKPVVDLAFSVPRVELDVPTKSNPFEPRVDVASINSSPFATTASSPPKRKHEQVEILSAKRQEVEVEITSQDAVVVPSVISQVEEGDADDDSDISVHLNMELDDDDEVDIE